MALHHAVGKAAPFPSHHAAPGHTSQLPGLFSKHPIQPKAVLLRLALLGVPAARKTHKKSCRGHFWQAKALSSSSRSLPTGCARQSVHKLGCKISEHAQQCPRLGRGWHPPKLINPPATLLTMWSVPEMGAFLKLVATSSKWPLSKRLTAAHPRDTATMRCEVRAPALRTFMCS